MEINERRTMFLEKFLPIPDDDRNLPVKHQIGKMISVGLAVIGIRYLSETVYDRYLVKGKLKK
jgi:hypothetical protein